MFNTNGGYSLSDIAAVSGNNGRNGGAFGDDWAWIVILLLCGWGNGGFGFGGGNGQGTMLNHARRVTVHQFGIWHTRGYE